MAIKLAPKIVSGLVVKHFISLISFELSILKLISQKNEGVRINRFLFSLRKHSKNMSKIKKKFILTYGERIFKKMKLGNYSINQNHPNYI